MDIHPEVGCTSDMIRRATAMYFAGASIEDFRETFGGYAGLAWCAAVTVGETSPDLGCHRGEDFCRGT